MSTISEPTPMGAVTVAGVVKINGTRATSGQTVFSGSSIVTSTESEANLTFDNLARLRLGQDSRLTLDFSRSNISGWFESGAMQAFIPAGLATEIKTPDASLMIDSSQSATFDVEITECVTRVSVQTGSVDLRKPDRTISVGAGQAFSTAASLLPQQSFSHRKRVGLFIGIAAAIAVILIALRGGNQNVQPQCIGTVVAPSGSGSPNTCQ